MSEAPAPTPPPSDDLPPISRDTLKALFDFLDRPNPPACTHTFAETTQFLTERQQPIRPTLEWLHRHGAGCDCEVIFNTEAEWGEYSGREPQ